VPVLSRHLTSWACIPGKAIGLSDLWSEAAAFDPPGAFVRAHCRLPDGSYLLLSARVVGGVVGRCHYPSLVSDIADIGLYPCTHRTPASKRTSLSLSRWICPALLRPPRKATLTILMPIDRRRVPLLAMISERGPFLRAGGARATQAKLASLPLAAYTSEFVAAIRRARRGWCSIIPS